MVDLDIQEVSREYFPRIHRAALVLTGNPWDADDLTQETFLVLARGPRKFEGRSSYYTWLYGILLNLERRRRRRSGMQRRKLRVLWDQPGAGDGAAPPAEAALEAAEWKKSLWSFVARLPEGQRQALVLRFSEHLQYDEIAVALAIPVGTAKSRVFNGLAALRTMLAKEHETTREAPLHCWEDIRNAL